MLIDFPERFADLVESGEKTQEIVPTPEKFYRGRGPHRGANLKAWTGTGTKERRKLGDFVCHAVDMIEIGIDGAVVINDCWTLDRYERLALARKVGFSSPRIMVQWIADTYGIPFDGMLLKW